MSELLSYLVLGLSRGLIYGLLALGLVLIFKGTKILNLAQPYFGLLAAFLAWWLTARAAFMPFEAGTRPRFLVAALVALVLVGLNGWLLEKSLFRKLRRAPRLVTLVATLAIAQGTLGLVVLLFERNADQAEELRILPSVVRTSFVVGDVGVTGGNIQAYVLIPLLVLAAAVFFKVTRFGVAIRAAAENADSARLLGISVDRVAAFTWIAGSVLAGIAGILLTSQEGSVTTTSLSTGFLVRALAAALIGGLTSLPGALVGGLVVGVAEAILSGYFFDIIGLAETVFFLGVIAILILRPQGLFGRREELREELAFVPPQRELPRALQRTAYPALVSRLGVLTAVGFAVAVSAVTGSATNGTFVLVVVIAMVGVSLTVLMGYTGQISLGHWALVGVGAFASANLFARFHVPFLLTVPLVVLIGMAISLVIGLPALRIRGLYLAVVTLAFSYAAELYLFKSDFFGGSQTGRTMVSPELGPLDLDDPSNRPLFLFGLAMLLISLWVARNLARSRTGRTFYALRENEKAAATLGIGLTRARLLAFAVSGGIAALAGVVYSMRIDNVNATRFPTQISLVLVLMVMIGGVGSLQGSILGALLVFGMPLLLEFENAWIVPIGTGILLIVVIVEARGGLAGLVQGAHHRIVRTLAELERPGSTAAGGVGEEGPDSLSPTGGGAAPSVAGVRLDERTSEESAVPATR